MNNLVYNAVDFFALGLILWEILMGLRRKAAGELFRLFCTALVLAVGWRYYLDLGQQLAAHTRLAANPEIAHAIAFAALIAMMGFLCALIHLVLGLLAQVQFAAGIDRLGGAIAGILRGALLVILLVFGANLWPSPFLREYFGPAACISGKATALVAPKAIRFLRAIKIDFKLDMPPAETVTEPSDIPPATR